MNFAQLQRSAREVIRDDSPEIDQNIERWINLAVNQVVDETDLPGFKSHTSVLTVVDTAYASLPATSSGKVTYVGDASGELEVVTLEELVSKYPEMDEEGDVAYVAIEGSLIYYQKIPDAATTLYIVTRLEPTEMSDDTDVPEGIPDFLHDEVIIPKVAFLAYSKIEGSLEENAMVNTNHWNGLYTLGKNRLLAWKAKRQLHSSRSFWRY